MVKKEIERAHDDCEYGARDEIDLKSSPRGTSHLGETAPSEQRSDKRSQAGGKTHKHHKRNKKHGIDERRGSEFVNAIQSHHHGIGETDTNHSHLSEQHRRPKTHQRLVLTAVFPEKTRCGAHACNSHRTYIIITNPPVPLLGTE